jgi:hypothetical protein
VIDGSNWDGRRQKIPNVAPLIRPPKIRVRRKWSSVYSRIGQGLKDASSVQCAFKVARNTIWVLIIAGGLLAVFFATNLVYQLLRKPVEVVAPLNRSWSKTPEETWRHYAPLFREYSTANVPAELLAALAQVEGAGNPIASPSWRWRLTGNPLKIYQPASSAIGMYQMTDGAFADARRYCIQNHVVVENGCPWNGLDSRLVPRRAIELTSVFLDRHVAAILSHRRSQRAGRQRKQELAAVIHLCGPVRAKTFAGRGFHLIDGERCGDHDVANYVTRIRAARQTFLRLAAQP